MTTQSNVQGLLEGGVGLQNTAQSGVPSGVNNGNPNTPYNWATYIPSILNGANGQPSSVNFNPITASVPNMSAYGNQTPFTPDPFMAMLLSQLRAPVRAGLGGVPGYGGGGNSMINNILANMLRGPATSTTPPTGGGATTPPVVTTPPVTTTPVTAPSTGATAPSGGTGGMLEAGPNTMPGTTLPYGTQGSLNAAIGNSLIHLPAYGGSLGSVGGGSSSPSYTSGSSSMPSFGTGPSGSAGTNFTPNPVGSGYDLSTSPMGSTSSPSTGNFFTRLLDSTGLVPANSSPGGFWSDLIASGAQSLGINGTMDPNTPNTFNPAQAAAGLLGGPAGSAVYNAATGANTPTTGNTLGGFSMDGPYIGSGMSGVEGLPQGSWNWNDTYTPPSYDFSNLSTGPATTMPSNFDPVAYLEQQRAAETSNTNQGSGPAPTTGAQGATVNTTVGQGGNGTYTSGPYNGMSEQQVRDMMATQTAFGQMQRDQEHAKLQGELQAFVSGKQQ